VIGTNRWRSEPLVSAKACHMPKRRVGVWYSPSHAGDVRPEAVLPDRALCLPTFSHFLIVNKTSLSLSLPPNPFIVVDAPLRSLSPLPPIRHPSPHHQTLCSLYY
jgi:hypothetical protein